MTKNALVLFESMTLKRKDLLDISSLSHDEIIYIFEAAKIFKKVFTETNKKFSFLSGRTVCMLFIEPSTRTRLSFEIAAKRLSADVISVAPSTSSLVKGESLIDTVKTLEAMKTGFIVMRHPVSLAPDFLSRNCEAHVINGGDGNHAHPTQALLDGFSVYERTGSLKGLKVAIVGDIKHSRVARSGIELFTKMGSEVVLCGPPTLLPDDFSLYGIEMTFDLDSILSKLDVVNMLRIQLERQKGSLFPSIREYNKYFSLTKDRLKKCRKDVIVMHPGPINRGIEIDDFVADCENAIIEEQVTNGIAVRMAVFSLLCGKTLEDINKEK